ncbi:hypothetical protein FGO68_gene8388 [Halteria grandinella]|uniref:Uncharacterized protein n=1 Tax=Halteria grandinella TaxID=5974 RepID=A0A8J8NYR9_HALGN|nr:hypothetical protein FGO68_gene8388 [Halteria grandinella]
MESAQQAESDKTRSLTKDVEEDFNKSAQSVKDLADQLQILHSKLLTMHQSLTAAPDSIVDQIFGVSGQKASLIEKNDDLDILVKSSFDRSQVLFNFINDAKVTASIMNKWIDYLVEMLPHIKYSQYLVPPLDIQPNEFFKITKFCVGSIGLVFLGGSFLVSAPLLGGLAVLLGGLYAAITIVEDIFEAFQKSSAFSEVSSQLDKIKENVEQANEQLSKSESSFAEFYASTKLELIKGGFDEGKTLGDQADLPMINSILAKSLTAMAQEQGKVDGIFRYCKKTIIAIEEQIKLGKLSDEFIRDKADILKDIISTGVDSTVEFDLKIALNMVLSRSNIITVNDIIKFHKEAKLELTDDENVRITIREMLEMGKNPTDFPIYLEEHKVSQEKIDELTKEFKQQQEILLGTLYKKVTKLDDEMKDDGKKQ